MAQKVEIKKPISDLRTELFKIERLEETRRGFSDENFATGLWF
jgi:hypothetical protein